MDNKLQKLEGDVKASKDHHEDVTGRALKRVRKDHPLKYSKKEQEEKFLFNLQVQDNLTAAARQLEKLEALDRDKQILKKAKDELKEDVAALADRQKMIWLADSIENGWGMAAEYKGYDFTNDKEDNKKMRNSEWSTGVKKRRMAGKLGQKKHLRQTPQAWGQDYLHLPLTPFPSLTSHPKQQHR